ncbi:hypothetical protein [Nostoc phage A1]|nr:hypothetical protein [Nostoc phage A1]
MYYNAFQQIIVKNKLKTILGLIRLINVDSLCYHDLVLLNKFILKSLFIFRLTPLKKTVIKLILESLYKTVESLIDKKIDSCYIEFSKKLDKLIFILKMISLKLYDSDLNLVEMDKNKITINDRYKHY